MLTRMIAASARTRTLRNAFCHWRGCARGALAERRHASALLRGVAAARMAVRLAPAVEFWRRWAVVVRAERDRVRFSHPPWQQIG